MMTANFMGIGIFLLEWFIIITYSFILEFTIQDFVVIIKENAIITKHISWLSIHTYFDSAQYETSLILEAISSANRDE